MAMEKPANDLVPTAPENGFSDVANRVFDLELLREKILNYAIHDEGTVKTSYVQSCRLVNKTWLQSTSRVLLKNQEPLFHFRLPTDHNGFKENELALNQFFSSVTEGSRLEEHVPPHYINLSDEMFRPENSSTLKSLFDCFVNCGSSLVELSLSICEDKHITGFKVNVYFPNLRKFDIYIQTENSKTPEELHDKIDFIQTVIASTEQLKSFKIPYCKRYNHPPDFLSSLTLPHSITVIELHCLANDRALEFLKKPLPHLKKLEFRTTGLPLQTNETITSILQNVRKTLQHLEVYYVMYGILFSSAEGPTPFQLPVMEKLQCLNMITTSMELQGNPEFLEVFLPVISEMTLFNQTIPMFRKWVDKSCFESVTSLTVSLNTESQQRSYTEDYVNFDSQTIGALKSAFPNLQKLDITFRKIKRVFAVLWEMKTLRNLRIVTRNTVEMTTSNAMDAFLLGIPVGDVSRLEESSDLWEDLQVKNSPSIRNLTDLQALKLDTYGKKYFRLISDVTFDFAFFEMPKLNSLNLGGGFKPTDEAKKKWIETGRTIEVEEEIYRFVHKYADPSDSESDDDDSDFE